MTIEYIKRGKSEAERDQDDTKIMPPAKAA